MFSAKMPSSETSRIFISYAHRDAADLAQRLQADLRQNGLDAWLDTARLTVGDVWSREIEKAVDAAEAVIALLTSGSFESDICRAEQSRALGKGKCVLPVRVQDDCDIPLEMQTRQYLDFSNLQLYDEQLSKLITAIRKQDGVVVPAGSLIRYNNAPALPQNFVARPELLERLRNTLFTAGANRNIAITAMQGMGGIGKTVLATALCHDEVVQQAFPDGIFWFSIGKESRLDFCALMKCVPAFDRLLGTYETEAGCINQYRDVLRKKAALIVVDDVWRTSDFQPFVAESPRSRLLITTRDTSIGAWFGAREFTANLLTEDESRKVLSKWSGLPVEQLPPLAAELIYECGSLPLALAMIGAQLRGRPLILWKAKLHDLRNADLESIKAQFPEPHTTLFRAIQISVEALGDKARGRYLALGFLLENMSIRPEVQQCLWGVDQIEAAKTVEDLISLSLARREEPEGSIHLHDLQLDYIRTQFLDREALELIHGAVRLSSHVINKDPEQFVSQLVGRLVPHQGRAAIKEFTERIARGAPNPWLRPLSASLTRAGGPLVRTLTGHTSLVLDAAVTPDGRRVVSASADNTLIVWQLTSGEAERVLRGHERYVTSVVVTPDGSRVISGSLDDTIRVWDLESGREVFVLRGHKDKIEALAVAPDSKRAISASADGTLKVWDLAVGVLCYTLTGHSEGVTDVKVTSDGRYAVSASKDSTLNVWDLEQGTERHRLGTRNWRNGQKITRPDGLEAVYFGVDGVLKLCDAATGATLETLIGHSDAVYSIALASDGRVVSASRDGTLRVWDLKSGTELRVLRGHSHQVATVATAPDGRRAISGSLDKTVRVWDLETGKSLTTLVGHAFDVFFVAAIHNGRRVLSASSDSTLKVWDIENGTELGTLRAHTEGVRALLMTSDGRRAISASNDRTLRIWDLEVVADPQSWQGHRNTVNAVAVTADGRFAVTAGGAHDLRSQDNTVRVWDVAKAVELVTLEGHRDDVWTIATTPDGRRAVSGAADNDLKVWDLKAGVEVATLRGHTDLVWDVEIARNGRTAVSASRDHTLIVWDLEPATRRHTLTGHTGAVRNVAICPHSRTAVSTSDDQTVRVWDLEAGTELQTFRGYTAATFAVTVTPDGSRAIFGDTHGSVSVWSLVTGGELFILRGHSGAVTDIAVSADNRLAVSASSFEDPTLRVWDLSTGRLDRTLRGHAGYVTNVVMVEGTRAVSGSLDHTVRLWDLGTGAMLAVFTGESEIRSLAVSREGIVVAGEQSGRVHFLRIQG
jgi:WD40 repeat protein